MSKKFTLARCSAACKSYFSQVPVSARDEAHREWHETRDSFAARELNFPFRRWYERASIHEVEKWHEERTRGHERIVRWQKMVGLAFGSGRFSRHLGGIVSRFVQARQDRRDERRIAAMQKAPRSKPSQSPHKD